MNRLNILSHRIGRRLTVICSAMAVLPAQLLANTDPTQLQSAAYGYAWMIGNFVFGGSAISVLIHMGWLARDMEENGRSVKKHFLGLIIIGAVWGLGAIILGFASKQGLSVSGVDTAINMKP